MKRGSREFSEMWALSIYAAATILFHDASMSPFDALSASYCVLRLVRHRAGLNGFAFLDLLTPDEVVRLECEIIEEAARLRSESASAEAEFEKCIYCGEGVVTYATEFRYLSGDKSDTPLVRSCKKCAIDFTAAYLLDARKVVQVNGRRSVYVRTREIDGSGNQQGTDTQGGDRPSDHGNNG